MNEAIKTIKAGMAQGWAKDNIITQVMYDLGTTADCEMLFICGDDSIPILKAQAVLLYEKYR